MVDQKIPSNLDPAHDALNRMRRAHERGTGCHLTVEMLEGLSLTLIGQMWEEADPREKDECRWASRS